MNNFSQFDDNETKVFGSSMSFAAKEAFNLLRTNLAFSFPDTGNERGHIIGVTSSNPSEGKTSTSINLSYSIADLGYSVLLIEADMRRPVIAKYLNVEVTDGLSSFLIGKHKNIIHKNVLNENMDVVFSGEIPLDPTVLIASEKMGKAIEVLGEKYDYVIIDLPPVLAVSDAVIMAKYLDGMLFVVRGEHTRKREVHESLRRLKYSGVRMLGFVYNDYADKTKNYYRKGGNKYYTHYGYGEGNENN